MYQFILSHCMLCCECHQKKGSFPFICPHLEMPCLAIASTYILNQPRILNQHLKDNEGRVALEYIDQAFLYSMNEALKLTGLKEKD